MHQVDKDEEDRQRCGHDPADTEDAANIAHDVPVLLGRFGGEKALVPRPDGRPIRLSGLVAIPLPRRAAVCRSGGGGNLRLDVGRKSLTLLRQPLVGSDRGTWLRSGGGASFGMPLAGTV